MRTSASTSATRGPRVGKVDLDTTAVEVLLVEGLDGGVSLLSTAEGHEAEAARATGLAVAHDDGL
jgi:hypothetical protein